MMLLVYTFFLTSRIISLNDNISSSAPCRMADGRLEERLGLRRQVTHDDAVNGGAMLLGLTILTPKHCSFHSIILLFIANSVP